MVRIKKLDLLFLIIIISAGIGIRYFYAFQKTAYHEDEFATIASIINYTNDKRLEFFESNNGKWIEGKKLLDLTVSIKHSEYFRNLAYLLKDTGVTAHPNLHYILFRAGIVFDIDKPDLKFNIYSVSYNSIFYIFTVIILFLFIKELFNTKLAIFSVFIYTFSTGAISNTLYFRMYEQFTAFMMFSSYMIYKYLQTNTLKNKYIILMIISMWLTLLTHYYSFLFFPLLFLIVAWECYKSKLYKKAVITYGSFITAVLAAQLFFHRFIPNLRTGRGHQTARKIAQVSVERFLNSFEHVYTILNNHFFYFTAVYIILILTIIIFIISKRKLKNTLQSVPVWAFYFTALGFALSIAIMYLSPDPVLRYLMPVLPFLLFLYPLIFKLLPFKLLQHIFIVFTVITSLFFATPQRFDPDRNVNYLFKDTVEKNIYRNRPEIPAVFILHYYWRSHAILGYFNPEQKYLIQFDETAEEIKIPNELPEKAYLIIDRLTFRWKLIPYIIEDIIDTNKWNITEKSEYYSFDIYLIEKK
jgi:hypothetical protein